MRLRVLDGFCGERGLKFLRARWIRALVAKSAVLISTYRQSYLRAYQRARMRYLSTEVPFAATGTLN